MITGGFMSQENSDKISLSKCKSVLQKDGSVYSDNDILEIRNFLYMLAELDYEVYLKMKIRDAEFENEKNQQLENTELKNAA
jgi:hypothetical protein